jgi:hypothetical protein
MSSAFNSQPNSEEYFDPFELRPLASFNRRVIIDLPGVEPGWVGQNGWSTCSKQALIDLIQAHIADLGLDAAQPEELPRSLSELIAGPDGPTRQAAMQVAALYGRRLGCLIASVLSSPAGLTAPLVEWEAAYLRYWRNEIRVIVLGGGLANGRLGHAIASAAEGALLACGLAERRVRAAADPSYLPLIGLARRLPLGRGQVAALADFGSSRAKRGLAYFDEGGALTRLRILPPVLIDQVTGPGKTEEFAEAIISGLAETIRLAEPELELCPTVSSSVAAYIRNGRPDGVPGREQGAYALTGLAEDITGWFAARISVACGREVGFQFTHDGDAAAAAVGGQPHTAVLMLGTSLGVGFAPPAEMCRLLSSEFKVDPV